MAASLWSSQKEGARALVRDMLASGQEMSVEDVVNALKMTGVTAKNALKAIYAAQQSENITLNGDYDTGSLRRGGV